MARWSRYGPDETISGSDEKVHVDCSDAYDAAVQASRYPPLRNPVTCSKLVWWVNSP